MPDFRVTKPSFHVSLATGYSQAAGGQDIVFDTVDYDDIGGWDGTSHFITDRPGLFLVGGAVLRSSVASTSSITLRLRVNDGGNHRLQGIASTLSMGLSLVDMIHLEEGDLLSLNCTLHPTIAATVNPTQTVFWASRLGPKAWR